MLRTIFSRVLWVGKATTFTVGLAVMLALTVGLAATAFAGDGDPFKLGKSNTASTVSKLIKRGAGPALELRVDSGAPLKVDSDARVDRLNADEVDGQSLSCPGGTLFHEGACIETTGRGPAAYATASPDCLDEARRLPTVAELQTFRNLSGHDFTGSYELTSQVDLTGETSLLNIVEPSAGTSNHTPIGGIWKYRCVASPS